MSAWLEELSGGDGGGGQEEKPLAIANGHLPLGTPEKTALVKGLDKLFGEELRQRSVTASMCRPMRSPSEASWFWWVTGAGQNLGRELAVQLARLGAKLVLLDINEKQNEATAELVRREGGEAHAYRCDVADHAAVAAAADKIRSQVGHPHYVFNNAGTYEHKPFLSHSAADIKRMVDVNLLGSLWVAREFLGHMVKHNSGHLVCISSVLGYIGRQNVVPYCASKFGVKGMTEALAEEMRMERRSGVRVTAVHPFLISNIDDVKPNLKFPWLFEVLETSDAAARIISGVRRNQEEIFLPEKLKPFMVFSKVLPRKLRRLFADYMES
ncbi:Epidermal retinol dehydrogenase 2 [Chionoecetes opilio]|uniref:Short-chain dehydrogenase/reductase 3 n=1 Tax=Chionoecetes opilio TaxID=41210 RepID=A0A8J4XRY5_CHIOP|nr:Epidermal retinol dehydrogenase 2 [Chionoecetes opilio]